MLQLAAFVGFLATIPTYTVLSHSPALEAVFALGLFSHRHLGLVFIQSQTFLKAAIPLPTQSWTFSPHADSSRLWVHDLADRWMAAVSSVESMAIRPVAAEWNSNVMVAILALVVAGVLALAVLVLILDVLRRLFWFALRLGASAAAAVTAGLTAAGLAAPEKAWVTAPAALAAGAMMLWFSRKWGRDLTTATAGVAEVPASAHNQVRSSSLVAGKANSSPSSGDRSAAQGAAPRRAASLDHDQLLDPALQQRLAKTEEALTRAGRDNLGQPAAEWLDFWHRRVPDLIAAAQGVWDDADPPEQASVAQRLADHLHAIIAEADARLVAVRDARRDLFNIRGNHADARMRDG